METTSADLFVGLDWGCQQHLVVAVDAAGQRLGAASFETDLAGLQALRDWVLQLAGGDSSRVVVGLERPDQPVVSVLQQAGLRVGHLNPKQTAHFRDRYSPSGAKDDTRDAAVLADSLRTDAKVFTEVLPDPAEVVELAALSKLRDDLQVDWFRLINRLRDQLQQFYPQVLELWVDGQPDAFCCRLLELAPTPTDACQLRLQTVENLRRRHRLRRFTAREVLDCLRAPGLPCAPGVEAAAATWVRLTVPLLQTLKAQLTATEQQLEQCLARLRQAPCDETTPELQAAQRVATALARLPFAGTLTHAVLVSEAWRPLAAGDLQAVRTRGGTAPVTRASGRSRSVTMRRACGRRLRRALYHWARLAAQADAHWEQAYDALRARGQTQGRALRTVADRLLKVLLAMIRDGTAYDPGRWSDQPAPQAA